MDKLFHLPLVLSCCIIALSWNAYGQQKEVTLKVNPNPTVVEVGKTLQLQVIALDSANNQLSDSTIRYWPLQLKGVQQNIIFTAGIEVDSSGVIAGKTPGMYDVIIMRPPVEKDEGFARIIHKVQVINQPVAKIDIENIKTRQYQGTLSPLNLQVLDQGGFLIKDADVKISSSNPEVLKIDNADNLHALSTGKSTITVSSQGFENEGDIEVVDNPVAKLTLKTNATEARTGDVLHFETQALDQSGNPLNDVPIRYSVNGMANEAASGASAMVSQEGRFVAEKAGMYTVTAFSGNQAASTVVEVVPRLVSQKIVMTGQGSVNNKHTSDFWVWEGVDGKDYAVTGTWGADGKAYFWEVTDPADITLIDSVQVDARTVNDVKVSEDGKICVISREGASNRKNGIIILDVTNPRDVQILSTYTEQLTGGVHNLFIYKDHVYALSNAQRYEIINIEDPANPKRVSKFELENSARSIHDVWIEDGIAYSSNWADGVVMVDIGNGVKGGSPENPVEIARGRVAGDANHAAFPYKSSSTGKFYVIAGDEIFPLSAMSSPNLEEVMIPAGYLHFMDFTDPDNPKEVARYEVPEAGSHNFWVEGDILYIGYYNGGLRVVDISGDLMGNLYAQGREIAHYKPFDGNGFVPNAPFVWGAQPYKGHIFFSDFNSGLWSSKLEPVVPDETNVEIR